MNQHDLENIHNSLINGQRRQMVDQINEYGLYDFFADYKAFLADYSQPSEQYKYFSDACISFMRITNK